MGKLPALTGNVPSEMTLLNARKRTLSSIGLDFLADECHGIELWNGSMENVRKLLAAQWHTDCDWATSRMTRRH